MTGLLAAVEADGIDPTRLVEGLPIDTSYLRARSNWLSWSQFAAILGRLEALLGPGGAEEAARGAVDDGLSYRRVVSWLVDSSTLYDFAFRVIAPSLLPCVKIEAQPLGGRRLRLRLTLARGLDEPPIFFDIARHTLRHLPALVDEKTATVTMERQPGQATFQIALPPRRSRLATMTRWLRRASPLQRDLIDGLADLAGAAGDRTEPEIPDYRQWLRNELEKRRARNPRFSQGAFSLKLGLTRSALSNILSGRRNLSVETAAEVAERLGLSAGDARRFCQAVQLGATRSEKLRRALRSGSRR